MYIAIYFYSNQMLSSLYHHSMSYMLIVLNLVKVKPYNIIEVDL